MTAREDLSLSLPDAVAAARQPMDPPTAEAPTVRAATAPATATVTLLPQQHTPACHGPLRARA
jgi:hypothetical protein